MHAADTALQLGAVLTAGDARPLLPRHARMLARPDKPDLRICRQPARCLGCRR